MNSFLGGSFTIITPFWILWFLLVQVYYLFLKAYILKYNLNLTVLLVGSMFISLLAGSFDFLGYKLSTQRALYFLPFFIAGILYSKDPNSVFRFKKISFALIPLFFVCFLFFSDHFSRGLLYGSRSYAILGINISFGLFLRLALLGTGFVLIQFIFAVSNHFSNSIMSKVGENSLSVYLLHGAIIVLARHFHLIRIEDFYSLALSFLISTVLVVLLASESVSFALKRLRLI